MVSMRALCYLLVFFILQLHAEVSHANFGRQGMRVYIYTITAMYVSPCVMKCSLFNYSIEFYNYAHQIFSTVPQAAKNGGLGASTSTQTASKVCFMKKYILNIDRLTYWL